MADVSAIVKAIFAGGRKRELEGRALNKFIFLFAVAIALYHLYTLAIWRSYIVEVHSFVHLSSLLVLVFFTHSHSKKKSVRLPVVDMILVLLAVVTIIHFSTRVTEKLIYTVFLYVPLSDIDLIFGILFMLLLFEGARRVVGFPFVIIIFLFLLAMNLGPYFPGKWEFTSSSWRQITDSVAYTALQGIWGTPLRISSTVIILFFIFGKFMQHAGIGTLLISLCQAIAGNARGGPAKVAVVASGLVGSVTGGPSTNIVMTGTFTIPMMKQVGYKPHYAGAVECAASTGSSIVPPVMTGVVFVMVALSGIPYATIMAAALLPALLYYLGILLQVHFQAIKEDIRGIADDKRSPIEQVLGLLKEQGHLLLPIILVVVLLLVGITPVASVSWAILSVVLAAALRKKTRMGPKRILIALNEAVRDVITTTLTLSLAGIIIVTLFSTGLGGMFSHAVSSASGDSLLLLALTAALASLILGMTGPIIGSYLITILIVAPAMVEAGLPTIVAHFFSLYFANIAFITPPVAVGAFVAAGIARTSFWRIGFTGIRLAIAAFVVPFIFLYRPALLMVGRPMEVLLALIVGIVVVASLASALEGWMLRKLNIYLRILLFVAAFALIPPKLLINIGAIILIGLILLLQTRKKSVDALQGTYLSKVGE
ncbi:TRAP transporter permease [Thermodesulfobacteriota bacterium]